MRYDAETFAAIGSEAAARALRLYNVEPTTVMDALPTVSVANLADPTSVEPGNIGQLGRKVPVNLNPTNYLVGGALALVFVLVLARGEAKRRPNRTKIAKSFYQPETRVLMMPARERRL